MEKIVEQGLLYDFYGPLLTAHQQKIYEQLVYENLTLNEIAEREGISKQAVHDLIRRCTETLAGYEEKLHTIRTFRSLQESADALLACVKEERGPVSERVRELAGEIKRELA
ncbi:MAG: sigma factor-like helix-turn-helix DNA-binding protein [Eubacteriales bacterium]|nr:sigma factor-like helix-turn-helix DNA-binding protein [Eubacteriales bacterium]